MSWLGGSGWHRLCASTASCLPEHAASHMWKCRSGSELKFKQAELRSCPVPFPLLSCSLPRCCYLDDFKCLGEVWNKFYWVPAKTNRHQACKSTMMWIKMWEGDSWINRVIQMLPAWVPICETFSHLCFFLDILLLLHLPLLYCKVQSSNSHVRNATGKKQSVLSGVHLVKPQYVNSEPGFIKCKRLEVLRYKTCSTSKASYMFAFPLQCFLCNPEGSCLIRSPNSVGSTWARIWGEENAMCWKARAASAGAGAADCCQPGRGA